MTKVTIARSTRPETRIDLDLTGGRYSADDVARLVTRFPRSSADEIADILSAIAFALTGDWHEAAAVMPYDLDLSTPLGRLVSPDDAGAWRRYGHNVVGIAKATA